MVGWLVLDPVSIALVSYYERNSRLIDSFQTCQLSLFPSKSNWRKATKHIQTQHPNWPSNQNRMKAIWCKIACKLINLSEDSVPIHFGVHSRNVSQCLFFSFYWLEYANKHKSTGSKNALDEFALTIHPISETHTMPQATPAKCFILQRHWRYLDTTTDGEDTEKTSSSGSYWLTNFEP